MPALPERPSQEHLRKQAKRLAKERSIKLAEAQRALATDYGFRTWPALMKHVAELRDEAKNPRVPLFRATRSGDAEAVKRLLAEGANPQLYLDGEAPLHAAARGSSLAIVEALIEGGAREWLRNSDGKLPLDLARENTSPAREAIVALLDRERIDDPSFRSAVAAIHAGDLERLIELIEAEPRLLHERIVQQEAYRRAERSDYFRDPKLIWFVANNPTLVEEMPQNIAEIARAMIVRGAEKDDLTYTLGLVMSSLTASLQGLQGPLMSVLLEGGAVAGRDEILAAAAHGQIAPLQILLALGFPMTAPIAATLGDDAALAHALPNATKEELQDAFSMAVINGRVEAARLTLDAGADVHAYMTIHEHGTALHSAAVIDNVPLIELLLARGARPDVRDRLWDSTPLGWAIHEGRQKARAALEPVSGTS